MMSTVDQESTRSGPSHALGWLKIFLACCSLGPLLLFVASQLGRISYLGELISNFQLFVLLSLIPFPVLFYFLGMKRWMLATCIPLVWSFVIVAWVYVPLSSPPAGEETIRLMSFNVLAKNPNHKDVLDLIKKHDPDVLLVVEYSNNWVAPLSVLEDTYPHRIAVPRWHGFGIAFFSKFPISDSSTVQLADNQTDGPALSIKLKVGQRDLRLVGVHAVSPMNVERLRIRNVQFEDISLYLSQCEEPTILLGDFNCTTWSPYLQKLMRDAELSDSRRGFGYLPTWNANDWPFQIPIDHFLVSDQIRVHDRSVGSDSAGSDHFPIFCEVSIAPK